MSLGQLLKDSYGLNEEDLNKALLLQKDLGGDIGRILVQTGSITETQLAEALSRYLSLPLFSGEWMEDEELTAWLSERLDYDFLIRNRFLPIKIDHEAKTLHAITDDPFNYTVFDYVLRSLGYTVQLYLAPEQTIKELSKDHLQENVKNFVSLAAEEDTEKLKEMAFEAPVINFSTVC